MKLPYQVTSEYIISEPHYVIPMTPDDFIDWTSARLLPIMHRRIGIVDRNHEYFTFEHGVKYRTQSKDPIKEIEVTFEFIK